MLEVYNIQAFRGWIVVLPFLFTNSIFRVVGGWFACQFWKFR